MLRNNNATARRMRFNTLLDFFSQEKSN